MSVRSLLDAGHLSGASRPFSNVIFLLGGSSMSIELHVRHVVGRYGRGVLRSGNIQANVTEVARVFRIRLDDAANAEAWIEMTVEVETRESARANGLALCNPA